MKPARHANPMVRFMLPPVLSVLSCRQLSEPLSNPATLAFGAAAPDAELLAVLEGPLEALLAHRTAFADRLRFFRDVRAAGRWGRRVKQARIVLDAQGVAAPVIHACAP